MMHTTKYNQPATCWTKKAVFFSLLLVGLSFTAHSQVANNRNSVMVTLTAGSAPDQLTLMMDGVPIQFIDFPKSKKFIQFQFPANYSNFSIRVFEMNEAEDKNTILQQYAQNAQRGIAAFDAQWRGKASSQQKGHEFNLKAPKGKNMVLQNLNKDGTAHGTLHDYILKFTVGGKTYLVDPQIRNRD